MRRYRLNAITFRDGFTMLSTNLANASKVWRLSSLYRRHPRSTDGFTTPVI